MRGPHPSQPWSRPLQSDGMRRGIARLLLALVIAAQGCGGDGSESGAEDKAACQTLADGRGENPDIYTDLLKMDLSSEMRTALIKLRDSTRGGELQSDTFEKGRRSLRLASRTRPAGGAALSLSISTTRRPCWRA